MTSKILTIGIGAVLLFLSGVVSGGESVGKSAREISAEIAPLVGETTFLVGHLDLRRFDPDRLVSVYLDFAMRDARQWGYDEASIEKIIAEVKTLVAQYRPSVQNVLDVIVDELDIKDVYLIGNFSEQPFLLATPIGNKTGKQKNDLADYLGKLPDFEFALLEHAGFLIAVAPHDEDRARRFLESYKPVEMPALVEALADRETDLLKFALVVPPQLLDLFPLIPEQAIPKEALNTIQFLAAKTRWVALGLDVVAPSLQLTIKTPKVRDARQLRNMLEGLVDMSMTFIGGAVALNDDPDLEPFRDYVPLVLELAKGGLRMLLPELDGDRLVVRLDSETKGLSVVGGSVAVALLLPAVQAAREAAQRMQCANSLKQIVIGFHNYHDTMQKLPPAYSVDRDGKPLHSWRVLILPFIDQSALYTKIRLDEPWDSEHNKQFHDVDLPIFRCPSRPAVMKGQCDFSVVVGKETVFDGQSNSLDRIKDGLSGTICLVERRKPVCWMDPTQEVSFEDACKGIVPPLKEESDAAVGSVHPGGAHCACWDGSVHFLPETTDLDKLKAWLGCDDAIAVTIP